MHRSCYLGIISYHRFCQGCSHLILILMTKTCPWIGNIIKHFNMTKMTLYCPEYEEQDLYVFTCERALGHDPVKSEGLTCLTWRFIMLSWQWSVILKLYTWGFTNSCAWNSLTDMYCWVFENSIGSDFLDWPKLWILSMSFFLSAQCSNLNTVSSWKFPCPEVSLHTPRHWLD